MAFCTKCGAQISDGAAFCTSCGQQISTNGKEKGTGNTDIPVFTPPNSGQKQKNEDNGIPTFTPPSPTFAPPTILNRNLMVLLAIIIILNLL